MPNKELQNSDVNKRTSRRKFPCMNSGGGGVKWLSGWKLGVVTSQFTMFMCDVTYPQLNNYTVYIEQTRYKETQHTENQQSRLYLKSAINTGCPGSKCKKFGNG